MRAWLGRLVEAQRRQLRRTGAHYSGRVFGIPLLVISCALVALSVTLVARFGRITPYALLLLFNAFVFGWFGYVVLGYDRDGRGGPPRS